MLYLEILSRHGRPLKRLTCPYTVLSFLVFSPFQVTIGVFGHEEKVIYEPLTPAAIQVNNWHVILSSMLWLCLFVPRLIGGFIFALGGAS